MTIDVSARERDYRRTAHHTIEAVDVQLWTHRSDQSELLCVRIAGIEGMHDYIDFHTRYVQARATARRRFALVYDIRDLAAPESPVAFLLRVSAFVRMHQQLHAEYIELLDSTTIVLHPERVNFVKAVFGLIGPMPERPVYFSDVDAQIASAA